MSWLGLLMLGAFVGFVVTYGLREVRDWSNPANVFSAVVSAAVSGGVFVFIQWLGGEKLGEALFMYPVGLAYGALCVNLRWVTGQNANGTIAYLHIFGFAVASILLALLLLSNDFRQLLPKS
jgi:hypothetical protein